MRKLIERPVRQLCSRSQSFSNPRGMLGWKHCTEEGQVAVPIQQRICSDGAEEELVAQALSGPPKEIAISGWQAQQVISETGARLRTCAAPCVDDGTNGGKRGEVEGGHESLAEVELAQASPSRFRFQVCAKPVMLEVAPQSTSCPSAHALSTFDANAPLR